MTKDVRMGSSNDTEDSWEVLSRTASNSSTDSRTPVALHFPVPTLERTASLQLDTPGHPQTAVQSPPRRMSLDERALASRRRSFGERFRRRRPVAVAREESEEEDDAMGACGDSDSSVKSAVALQQPDTPPQPPQQFYGVLAGDSWYSVAGPTPAATLPPITIIFAGISGSGKTSTCHSFSGSSAEAVDAEVGIKASTVILEGRTATVVDTPGLGHQGAQEAVLMALRDHSLQGGSVVLGLTVSLSMAFDDAQAAALSALLTAAGPDAAAHAVLLFTHGDASDQDRTFLPNYLDEAPAALQEIARAVGGRTAVLANAVEGTSGDTDDSCSPQLLHVLALATAVAAHGDSGPWVRHVCHDDSVSQRSAGGDVSRLRKAVVYSLAACGMMGLRVLTSGGSGFVKKREGPCYDNSEPNWPSSAPHMCCTPPVWHLNEDAARGSGNDSDTSDGAQRSDSEAFVEVAATES